LTYVYISDKLKIIRNIIEVCVFVFLNSFGTFQKAAKQRKDGFVKGEAK
jgi:hypothetical protein